MTAVRVMKKGRQMRPYLRFGGSPCWTRTNDLAVNSRSLLPTELRRNIQFSFFCGSRSPLATSGPLVATRFSLYAKISASLALGFGLFRHTVSKLNAVAPTELRRNIQFSFFCGSRSPLATSGPLVATRFSLYAKISASLALGFGLFRHTVSKLNAVAPTELRRNIRFSLF